MSQDTFPTETLIKEVEDVVEDQLQHQNNGKRREL